MAALGWTFTATMGIGTGCTVHLANGELPMGRTRNDKLRQRGTEI